MPSTPSSLVKLSARLASVSTGASSSRPTSDQVPLEMYAKLSLVVGTVTTADAVSWPPTEMSGTGRDRRRAGAPTVPGSTSDGMTRSSGSPYSLLTSAKVSALQRRFATSSRPVVDAIVTSATPTPVNQCPIRSGSRRTCSVRSQPGCDAPATSWKIVLNGITWSPLRAYRVAAGIWAKTASGTPSVRESR